MWNESDLNFRYSRMDWRGQEEGRPTNEEGVMGGVLMRGPRIAGPRTEEGQKEKKWHHLGASWLWGAGGKA